MAKDVEQVIVMKDGCGINVPKSEVKNFTSNGWVVKGKAIVEEPVSKPAAKKEDDQAKANESIESLLKKKVINKKILNILKKNKITTCDQVKGMRVEELADLPIIDEEKAQEILDAVA